MAINLVNGTELTSPHLDTGAYLRNIDLDIIRPGKSVDNASNESVKGRLREECLSQNWFVDLDEVQAAPSTWKEDYNLSRPHTSLGGLAQAEYVARLLDGAELDVAV